MIHFDAQNGKMMSHFAEIIIRNNKFPLLKLLCNYIYQLLQVLTHLRWHSDHVWVFYFPKKKD